MSTLQLQSELNKASRRRRRVQRAVLLLLGLIAALLLSCSSISLYIGYQLTRPAKKPITQSPADFGMHYTEQIFISEDGDETKLPGWVIEPEKPIMTIIMSHGYRGNRLEKNVPFLPLAKYLTEAGYRIILFDFRYGGEAEGEMITLGTKEKYDLLGVINWAKREFDEPVGLYGISMGASTSLLAAGLSEDVVGVVADSPFSDLKSYLSQNMSVWTGLPHIPFTPLTMLLMPYATEIETAEANPMKALDQIYPRPILFIHGTGDTYIPYSESQKMAATHPDRFLIWNPEGIQHVKSFKHHEEAYVSKLISFFESVRKEVSVARN
jgi:uncharacterized protein